MPHMTTGDDSRLRLIHEWLAQLFGHDDFDLRPASADASFRRYFRVRIGDRSRIVMDAPPALEDCRPFIAVAGLFARLDLHVPGVLAQDLERGLLLLDDLGERPYLDALAEDSADALYGDAIAALIRLQSAAPEVLREAELPPYDRELLLSEMGLFRDWYLQRHLGLRLTPSQQAILAEAFEFLADAALAQPRVIVHRDYHSRNLMVCEPNPGILDFQDAVIGPYTYDPVSLLRDCYIVWPQARVRGWAQDYFGQAQAAGILPAAMTPARFQRDFDLMGIQRHLKASGIFARLNHRDGKPGYLNDIPRTLDYVRQAGAACPELAAFLRLLEELPPAVSG